MERFLQDVRFALRLLRRSPGFTAVALLTLALGIGANTAIFSVVNGVILRPLGYPKPEQLMYLTTEFPGMGLDDFWVSPPEYMEFREISRSFSAVGAFQTGEVNLSAGDQPIRARSAQVDEHLFKALGLQAAQGRLFAPGEAEARGEVPAAAIAVLSHELWQTAFGGRPIVGERIEVNGVRRDVIGVLPPGADVMDNRTEIWLPLGIDPANRQNRGNHYLYLIGRLRDGVTEQAANAELEALMKNWGERVDVQSRHVFERPSHYLQIRPVQEEILGAAGRSIWVLQAAVGFVLLIACANMANLLLARAETRQREFAVRTAIGATRARMIRQFMTEGVILSIAGGALGLLLARVGVRALVSAYPASLPRTSEVTVDPAVLLFTCAVAMVTGLLFGLAPIVHTRVTGLVMALKEGGATGATGSARHHVRRALVAAEVALAVMLVIGAGWLVRTVSNLASVDAGFDRSRLMTFSITLPQARYPTPYARSQMYQRVLDRLRELPGVQAVTAMSGLPPERPLNANDTAIDNYTPGPDGPAENVDYYQSVMDGYFETMGIPLVQGRGFERTDIAASGRTAVVNEALANRFWKGLNPIGQRLKPCCNPQIPWFTVVGVAKDVKQGGVDQPAGTEVYFYVEQSTTTPGPGGNAPATMNMVLRTTQESGALAASIARVVREADPTVPIVRLQGMDGAFAETIRRPRLLAQLIGAFAALALLLAAIGTYGVLSYMVAERRREIGIRLALGAERSSVLGEVMTQGLVLTIIGVAAGVAAALGLNRLVASLLFNVQPTDAVTLVVPIATIAAVAAFSCWLPAWRASRLDPNVVLRED